MSVLFLLLAACGLLLSACGSAGPNAPADLSAQQGGRPFRVMTFNLHHGIDGTSRYNLQRAIDAIARIQPDLAGLQEVTRNHSSYDCDDQPALLVAGLERATGRPWYQAYVKEWTVHTDRVCVAQGRGDGPNTEGLAFIAPEPIEAVTHHELWNSRLGLAARVRSAGDVSFIVTHLASGSRGARDRTREIAELLPWADGQGMPRVLMGDMNARPGAPELAPVMHAYRDAWSEASSAGASRGVPDGVTQVRGSGRVDYIFFTPAAGLRLAWVETVDTSGLLGVHASDHHPVVASFTLP